LKSLDKGKSFIAHVQPFQADRHTAGFKMRGLWTLIIILVATGLLLWYGASFARAETPQVRQETPQAQGTSAMPPVAIPTSGPTSTLEVIGNVTVLGNVVLPNGDPAPKGLPVSLFRFESMDAQPEEVGKAETLDDGSFAFNGIEMTNRRVLIARVTYKDVFFNSDPLHPTGVIAGDTLDTVIQLSEVINDVTNLSIKEFLFAVDFAETGDLRVYEQVRVGNNSPDQVVAPAQKDQALVIYSVPPDAKNFQLVTVSETGRFVNNAQGFGDTMPISPGGSNVVEFAYDLPYTGQRNLVLDLPLTVESLIVATTSNGLVLESSQVQPAPEQMQQEGINMYVGTQLVAGSKLELNLSGKPQAGSAPITATGTNTGLIIGVVAFVVALGLGGFWLYRQRQKTAHNVLPPASLDAPIAETTEDLLDQIVALDDLYNAGQFPDDAYQERREALKEQLRKLKQG